ncbi:hypothetical protein YC2023_050894 [Brassica napus]
MFLYLSSSSNRRSRHPSFNLRISSYWCSSMYKIIDHPFLIRFISPTIIYEVITGAPEINLQS